MSLHANGWPKYSRLTGRVVVIQENIFVNEALLEIDGSDCRL